jgi:16S rRNA (cytosine1402-N4)-methyltransferase
MIKKRPVSTTSELAEIIKFSIPKTTPINTTKSIARVFQAFRIAVNNELDSLRTALEDSIDLLAPKGRIIIISYHSLEDRIVKDIFKRESIDCICPPKLPACVCNHRKKLNIITKKPVMPNDDEIRMNPRSRSAKLRAAERI